jgi:uncharacterized Rmd1/YagE family protein
MSGRIDINRGRAQVLGAAPHRRRMRMVRWLLLIVIALAVLVVVRRFLGKR